MANKTPFLAVSPLIFILLVILIGLNLRPALSSLAPLLPTIEAEAGFSIQFLSSLTTLPVLCLGLFAPFALWLIKRQGFGKALTIGLLILAAGNSA